MQAGPVWIMLPGNFRNKTRIKGNDLKRLTPVYCQHRPNAKFKGQISTITMILVSLISLFAIVASDDIFKQDSPICIRLKTTYDLFCPIGKKNIGSSELLVESAADRDRCKAQVARHSLPRQNNRVVSAVSCSNNPSLSASMIGLRSRKYTTVQMIDRASSNSEVLSVRLN